jgi:hypothetical protein
LAQGRVTPRQLWVVLESVHAVTYFAPGCRHALRDAGLQGFWHGYFAARAAPLGAVGAGPVAAAFFNFHPAMVRKAVPSCWDVVDPARLVVERAAAASVALEELCGGEARAGVDAGAGAGADALEQGIAALPALRAASLRCGGDGRVMTGANAKLWPLIEPELRRRELSSRQVDAAELWQASTTLREHRGDGHVAALLAHGLSGLDAHLLAAGTQGVEPEVFRDNRGWTEAQWDGAQLGLVDRGLLQSDGSATEAGFLLRQNLEAMTDDLAAPPFATLPDEELARLYASLLACARRILGSGCIPFPNPLGLPEL